VAKEPAKGRKTATKTNKTAEKGSESAAAKQPLVDVIPAEVHAKPASTAPAPQKATPAAAPKTPAPKAPTPPATPAPAQQSGFLPLVLGGLIAGVIGFAVATFTAPSADNTLATQVATQSRAITALEQRVANQPAPDFSAVEAALSELSVRIDAIEARPATSAAPTADVSGVNADMDALRAQIAEMTGAAQTELAEARAEAAAIEENAASAARNAAARAALARVQTGLESGAPIGAALGDLEQATNAAAPAGLIAAQGGVPTLASLQEEFPEAARAALATARSEGVAGEETTGLGAFLRTQFDVRSTAPREGDDADAILSRAEAAIRTGRLSDTLAEISGLPEVARAEMSGWLAKAELRAGALDAADSLFSSLSDN
jgi:hypothetical protein